MKKITYLTALALISASLLTGCGGNGDSASDTTPSETPSTQPSTTPSGTPSPTPSPSPSPRPSAADGECETALPC